MHVKSGAGCSKLTTLVNTFVQISNAKITNTMCFFVEKCENQDSHIFPTKNNGVVDNLVKVYLTR